PTFLTFPPYEVLSREPATSSKRGAGRPKLAPGKSQIGRCSTTGGVSCQIFLLKHCPPPCTDGFFRRPVARAYHRPSSQYHGSALLRASLGQGVACAHAAPGPSR